MSTRDENMVAALRRERAAYVAQGKDDRVEQVDDQLRRLGAAVDPDGGEGPQDRTPDDPAQQTADQAPAQTAAAAADGGVSSMEATGTTAVEDEAAAAAPAAAKKTARRSAVKE
ncbi:hypothetical protein ACFV2A_01340 [Streptomyces californicus]|uniref:hypothetical protein n=1 Tax=Streptomyces californicus TaxID=67351 RepID=UPI00369AC78D